MSSLKFVRLLVVFAAWAVVSDAFAQEAPSPEDISRAIREQVPSFWTVDEVRITASVNLGDPVEPNVKQRFEAVATPAVDLFVPDSAAAGSFAPFLPLLPTAAGGSHRTLYGVATSTYRAGAWTVQVVLENPVSDLGKPTDLFSQPTIVRGSEAEKAFADRLRTDIVADARTALETALIEARAAQSRAMEQLEAGQRSRLAELARTQAEQIAALEAELETSRPRMQTAFDTLERDYAGRLTALREKHTKEQAELARQLEADLAATNQRHAETLASLEREHATAVERLKAEIGQRQELLQLEQQRQKAIDEVVAAQRATLEKEQKAADEKRRKEVEIEEAARAAQLDQLRKLEAALRGNDRIARSAAMERVFSTEGNAALRNMAGSMIRDWVSKAKSIGGTFESVEWDQESPYKNGSFSIAIENSSLDGDVINFTGSFVGGAFTQETLKEKGSGSFLGSQLSFGNPHCSLSADLSADYQMYGRLICNTFMQNDYDGCWRSDCRMRSATVVIPIATVFLGPTLREPAGSESKGQASRVGRGRLGLSLQPMDEQLARTKGFNGTHGVLVSSVENGSPSQRSGIEAGDIIINIEGENIKNPQDVVNKIKKYSPGDRIRIKFFRNKNERSADVQLGEQPNK
jgi:hypothetical protein